MVMMKMMDYDESDDHNFLWGLLSFFFPLVGWILAAAWWRDRHSNAKACLIGSLIPVGLLLLVYVALLLLAGVAMFGLL